MPPKVFIVGVIAFGLVALAGCGIMSDMPKEKTPVPDTSKTIFSPSTFSNLPAWPDSNPQEFLNAFEKTCTRIGKKDSNKTYVSDPKWGTVEQWQSLCTTLPKAEDLTSWIEANFTPVSVRDSLHKETGLFTGYYEASLKGSRTQSELYNVKLRARPDDLVMVDLGNFRDELKGQRIAGRVVDGKLKPYEDRSEIIASKLPPEQDNVLFWVDDAVDAFFLEIQGSGVIDLDTGETVRVGYAGQNGHIYTAIGKKLIEMGELQKEKVSLQTIRDWLKSNPDKAQDIMNENRSYVFFEEKTVDGAVGGENVVLTAERSLAIDHGRFPYGLPFWVDIKAPIKGERDIQRLMVGQDTGGAIKGAVRGDVFWGHGDRAEYMAGHMKSQGRYWLLLPNFLDISAL